MPFLFLNLAHGGATMEDMHLQGQRWHYGNQQLEAQPDYSNDTRSLYRSLCFEFSFRKILNTRILHAQDKCWACELMKFS